MIGVLKAWNRVLGKGQNVHATGNALHIIDEEDAATHQGEGFHIGRKFFVAPDEIVIFAGAVGADKRVHFQSFGLAATTGPIELDFYGDCEAQSGTGSLASPVNRRLDITSSSDMQVRFGVTLTNTGTLIVPTANLASPSIGGRQSGQDQSFFHGFVLDNNKTYAIALKNTSVDSAELWANFSFNEPAYI